MVKHCGLKRRTVAKFERYPMQMKPSKGQLHIAARIRKRCTLKARKVITPGKRTTRQPLTSAAPLQSPAIVRGFLVFGTRATVFAPSGRETRGVPNLSRVIAKAVINYRYCP